MDTPPTLGEQELELLRHVAERGPLTVGQAADTFGGPRGLARSTVLTVMERLRRKGYLSRKQHEGVYQYASAQTPTDLMRGVVGDFVRRTLSGSVSPFVNYLSETPEEVSDEELALLHELVAKLEQQRKERPS